jgi:hypothetical protein
VIYEQGRVPAVEQIPSTREHLLQTARDSPLKLDSKAVVRMASVVWQAPVRGCHRHPTGTRASASESTLNARESTLSHTPRSLLPSPSLHLSVHRYRICAYGPGIVVCPYFPYPYDRSTPPTSIGPELLRRQEIHSTAPIPTPAPCLRSRLSLEPHIASNRLESQRK